MAQHLAYFFNPTCEMEIANGEASYTPPSHLQRFTQDLETLPFILASKDDCVIVSQQPDDNHLETLKHASFELPTFIVTSRTKALAGKYKPCPWGWSPSVARKLKPLGAVWKAELKPFYSRQFSLDILQTILKENLPHLIEKNRAALLATSITDVENTIKEWGKIVIKAPYSSSGRGVFILRNKNLDQSFINKINSLITTQGGVMVEPLHDKIGDFAFEFQIKNKTVSFMGFSSFTTDENGQYKGNTLPFSPNYFPKEAADLWHNDTIALILEKLTNTLQNRILPTLYEGYLGIDALILRDNNSKLRIHPCLEINLRSNMGIIALHLEKHLAPGSIGEFKIISNANTPLPLFDKENSFNHPLVIKDKQIISGYLPLTPALEKSKNMAYLIVSKPTNI